MRLKTIILFPLLLPLLTACKDNKDASAQRDNSGYKTYVSKDPFTISVHDDFPSDKSMALNFSSLGVGAIAFRLDDNVENNTRKVAFSTRDGIDISVLLDKNGNAQGIMEIMLKTDTRPRTQRLQDLNADGFWDVRTLFEPLENFIWMQSQWIQVSYITRNGVKVEAELDNKKFSFDRTSGQWEEKQ
jgi:hypothetical protein